MPEASAAGPLLISVRIAAFVAALAVALSIASLLANRSGLDAAPIRRSVIVSVLLGLLAARLVHAALHWNAFAPDPWTVLYLWQPGYLPMAGLAGGALFLIYRLRAQSAGVRLSSFRAAGTGLAAGAVILAAGLGTAAWFSGIGVLRAGDPVPDFRLVNLRDETVSLSDLEGKGVVLNFWATWCPPCRREMPLLEAVWNEYRSRDLVVVGVAVGEPRSVVHPFVDAQGVSYPIWTDPDGGRGGVDSHDLLERFGSAGLPTTVFIDADGVIASVHLGELKRELLRERLPAIVPKGDSG